MSVIRSVNARYLLSCKNYALLDHAETMLTAMSSINRNNASVVPDISVMRIVDAMNHHDRCVNQTHVDPRQFVLFCLVDRLLVSAPTDFRAIQAQVLAATVSNAASTKNVPLIEPVSDTDVVTHVPDHVALELFAIVMHIIRYVRVHHLPPEIPFNCATQKMNQPEIHATHHLVDQIRNAWRRENVPYVAACLASQVHLNLVARLNV